MSFDETDPFASGGEANPSISWEQSRGVAVPVGTTIVGKVIQAPKLVQSRVYNSEELAWWPAGKDGKINPKMTVVTTLEVEGELRSLWAPKPSALFAALSDAQAGVGRIAEGDTLSVTFTGEEPTKAGYPKKLFTAKLHKPDVFAPADVFKQISREDAAPVHNQLPYTPPTAANTVKTNANPDDFAALAVKVRDYADMGVGAGQIATKLGINVGTVEAILSAPAA